MNIRFNIKNTKYILTSDSLNFILKVEGNPKLTTYYSTIGGLLESVYQIGLKDNNVTSFRELAKHSDEIRDLVGRVEKRFKQVTVRE
jgi:hypothetical protein